MFFKSADKGDRTSTDRSASDRYTAEADERIPLLTLASWGLIATGSFVAAFMALQFSDFDDRAVTAVAEVRQKVEAERTASNAVQSETPVIGVASRTDGLSTDIDLLRKEVVALRRTVAAIRESRDALAVRLGRVEQTYDDVTASIGNLRQQNAALTTATVPEPQQAKPALPDDPLPLDAVRTQPDLPPIPPIPRASPQTATRVIALNRQKPAPAAPDPVITGTASQSADQAAAPPEATERTEFGVDLGGYASLATLANGWKDLKIKQKTLLGTLTPKASLSDKNGRLEVRLVAGPFANAAKAITLCAKLQTHQRPCQPTLFVGQPVIE